MNKENDKYRVNHYNKHSDKTGIIVTECFTFDYYISRSGLTNYWLEKSFIVLGKFTQKQMFENKNFGCLWESTEFVSTKSDVIYQY